MHSRVLNIVLSAILSVSCLVPRGFAYAIEYSGDAAQDGYSLSDSFDSSVAADSFSDSVSLGGSVPVSDSEVSSQSVTPRIAPVVAGVVGALSFLGGLALDYFNGKSQTYYMLYAPLATVYGNAGDTDGDGYPDISSTYTGYNGLIDFLYRGTTSVRDGALNGTADSILYSVQQILDHSETTWKGLYTSSDGVNWSPVLPDILSSVRVTQSYLGNSDSVFYQNISSLIVGSGGKTISDLFLQLRDTYTRLGTMSSNVTLLYNNSKSILTKLDTINTTLKNLSITGVDGAWTKDDIDFLFDFMTANLEGLSMLGEYTKQLNLLGQQLKSVSDSLSYYVRSMSNSSDSFNIGFAKIYEAVNGVITTNKDGFNYTVDSFAAIMGRYDSPAAQKIYDLLASRDPGNDFEDETLTDSLRDSFDSTLSKVFTLFPFCLPLILLEVFDVCTADAVTPELDITLPLSVLGDFDLSISLVDFDGLAAFCRALFCFGFIVALIKNMNKFVYKAV